MRKVSAVTVARAKGETASSVDTAAEETGLFETSLSQQLSLSTGCHLLGVQFKMRLE